MILYLEVHWRFYLTKKVNPFILLQILTSVLLNRVCATKMLIARTVTVPIAVLVNKAILEMEQPVKVLSRLPSLLPRLNIRALLPRL